MNFVNRGYILVKPTLMFVEWANAMEDEMQMDFNFVEGNVYLIEEDFLEVEPILKANFKKIFINELEAITEEEEEWPCEIKMENFELYFTTEFGTTVFDTQKSDLRKD
jgi:hypothetical protein